MEPDLELKQLKISARSPEDIQNRELRLESARQHQAYASSRASLMFGCYRRAEASDPEIYAAATAAVLSEYPQEVIDYITDPRTGIPSTSQWLPSVFEVRKACKAHVEHLNTIRQVEALRERRRKA